MAQALRAGLRNGGLRRGGFRPGLGNGSLFAIAPLDMFFARTRTLDSRVTFTRASSGRFVNSQGVLQTASNNEPRFDHNPTTGESLGLLVEEQRTNLLLRSQELDTTSVWGATNVTVSANTITAPDGTQTADTITDINGITGNPFLLQTVTLVDSTTYTMSCFLKAGTTTTARVGIRAKNGTLYLGGVDLVAGTITTSSATSVSIEPHQNGWYRCVVTGPSNTGATSARGLIYIDTISYTGTGTGSIHVWGAQLEAGAFASSYIPTTTAAATRSADVASITGTNFSSWYRQDEGTVFADVNSAPVNNVVQLGYDISEGVGNERMFQRRNASGVISTAVVDNGVTQADIGGVAISASARYRSGFAYKLNDIELVVNGGGSVTDTSATLPTLDRIHIGQNYASGQSCNGTIRRLTYWPQRLANSILQAITQ